MFRVTTSILSDGDGDHARADAQLIHTAVLLGFCLARATNGHPVEFSWNEPDEEDRTRQAAQCLQAVLPDDVPVRIGVRQTPPWSLGGLITGAAGAASSKFPARHRTPSGPVAEELRQLAADEGSPVGYRGPGAYSGFVDDPLGNTASLSCTARFNVPRDSDGSRWRRAGQAGPWGLIQPESPDMVVPTQTDHDGVAGYTHGMINAIYTAVARGPWCTPFEIAVGTRTTKLASCVPCALFMYAAGYPPSAIHLGRGDSWLPRFPQSPNHHDYSPRVDEAIRSTNIRWQLECRQHLELGSRLLSTAPLTQLHRARRELLDLRLQEASDDIGAGGNLLLDACTVHGRVADHVTAVLDPH